MYFHQIEDDEQTWFAEGKNLDHEYAEKYYNASPPELRIPLWNNVSVGTKIKSAILLLLLGFVTIVFVTIWLLRKSIRSRTTHAQDT